MDTKCFTETMGKTKRGALALLFSIGCYFKACPGRLAGFAFQFLFNIDFRFCDAAEGLDTQLTETV